MEDHLDEINEFLDDLTSNIDVYIQQENDAPSSNVKEYAPRTKDETKTNHWTLFQRRYPQIHAKYYRKNAEKLKAKAKERYHNDPIYRERVLLRSRMQNQQKQQEKLEMNKNLCVC